MSTIEKEGVEFDPGFGPYIYALKGSLRYIYLDINKFKNFSQKKTKFLQFHKKILELFENNLGFYIGCLMWGAYLKTLPKQEILSNNYYGLEISEEENKSETQFMLGFCQSFSRDMKYFLAKEYSFDEKVVKLIETYEEFLILNKAFTEAKYNTDIILPESINTEKATEYKEIIEGIIKQENLSLFNEHLGTILK